MGTPVVDSNCYIGRWPTRDLPATGVGALTKAATSNSIDICLVSSLDSIFQRDRVSANKRMVTELLDGGGPLRAVPVLDPSSPFGGDPESDLVRLVPCHHRYSLASRAFRKALAALEAQDRTVFISARMRDERLLHPMIRHRPFSPKGLVEALSSRRELSVVVNNAKASEIRAIVEGTGDGVLVDCGWSMPIGFIKGIVEEHGDHRLVLGSNFPLHYYQCSLMQITRADLPRKTRSMILGGNILRVIPR